MIEKYCDIEYHGYLILIKRITHINEDLNYFSFQLKKEGTPDRFSTKRYPDLLSVISRAMKDVDSILGGDDRLYFEGAAGLFNVRYKYHEMEVWEHKDRDTYSGHSTDPNFTEEHEDYASVIESFRSDVESTLAEEKTKMKFLYTFNHLGWTLDIYDEKGVFVGINSDLHYLDRDVYKANLLEKFKEFVGGGRENKVRGENNIKALLEDILEDKDRRIAELEKENMFLKKKLHNIRIETWKTE